MNSPASPGARQRAGLLLLFLGLTLVVINLTNWFVVARVGRSLEEEIGLRLTTVARAAVSSATAVLLLEPDAADDAFVLGELEELRTAHELEDVFVLDPAGNSLYGLRETGSPAGRAATASPDAFARAAAGELASSGALDLEGSVVHLGFAPVAAWDGTVEAVLGVAATDEFFAHLPTLRRRLWFVTAGSAALIALLGVVFFGMTRRLAATESALTRNETLRSMGMMAAGVAHEIRNPLAIISGTAARLKRKYAGDGSDPLFDFIPEEVERLNEIVEGYLRFAKDEPLSLRACDLRDVVERSARLVAEEVAAQGVTIVGPGGGEALAVQADPQRIRQVLLNLLLNAAQAMPEGGRVEVSVAREAARAVVIVRDEGKGFDPDALHRAFEPFFTTKERGSGLGLVMVKRIVDAHGGAVRLENAEGGGARVTVTLPAG